MASMCLRDQPTAMNNMDVILILGHARAAVACPDAFQTQMNEGKAASLLQSGGHIDDFTISSRKLNVNQYCKCAKQYNQILLGPLYANPFEG
jgi:hypothetical protein